MSLCGNVYRNSPLGELKPLAGLGAVAQLDHSPRADLWALRDLEAEVGIRLGLELHELAPTSDNPSLLLVTVDLGTDLDERDRVRADRDFGNTLDGGELE